MRGINTVFILGRLGSRLEAKTTTTGKQYVDLNVATNRPVKKEDAWTEETDWHRIRFWGKQAQTCCKYLSKGSLLAVEGSLRTDQWIDDDGVKQYRSYVLGQQLHLMPKSKPSLNGLVPLS